jgi:hypothetical protein
MRRRSSTSPSGFASGPRPASEQGYNRDVLRTVLAAAAVFLVVVPISSAVSPGEPAGITLSTTKAGARPVVVTVRLRFDMVCGQPGAGPIVIRFPRQETMPTTIAPAAVLVNGKPAARAGVSGPALTVVPSTPQGVQCNVITRGAVAIVLDRAARLGNPVAAGRYTVAMKRGLKTFTAGFEIRR